MMGGVLYYKNKSNFFRLYHMVMAVTLLCSDTYYAVSVYVVLTLLMQYLFTDAGT